jgi:hypothetical protein
MASILGGTVQGFGAVFEVSLQPYCFLGGPGAGALKSALVRESDRAGHQGRPELDQAPRDPLDGCHAGRGGGGLWPLWVHRLASDLLARSPSFVRRFQRELEKPPQRFRTRWLVRLLVSPCLDFAFERVRHPFVSHKIMRYGVPLAETSGVIWRWTRSASYTILE